MNFQVVRFKDYIDFQEGPGILAENFETYGIPLLRISNIKNDVVYIENCNYISYENFLKKWKHFELHKNDILISCSASTDIMSIVGKDSEGAIAYTGIIRLRTLNTKIVRLFIWWFVKSNIYLDQVNIMKSGSTIQHLGPIHLKRILLPLPPLPEQKLIASYLDRATNLIDRAAAVKKTQLEKLEGLKKSIIYRAVTKGLDDSVEMKDSGIEWIGKIPKGWEVRRIKRFTIVKRGASPRPIDDPKYFDEEGEFAWVRIADVSASDRYLENTTQQLSHLGTSLSVKQFPGDLFISIAGTVGKPIITKIKCCIHDGFVWFEKPRFNKDYIYYIILSGQPYLGLGKLGTQLNLNTDTIGKIFIPCPPLPEQQAIAEYLDKKTSEIDGASEKITLQIQKLEEYKKSLIHECVTGKRRITEKEIPEAV